MHPWIFHQHSSMVTVALGITFIAICYDLLPSQMGAQAWTYHYTTDPLTYDLARSYCKKHFTDLVAIQNKDEIAYLNKTLPKPEKGYYWIGIRKREEKWTWVGTGKVLTPEAENWATGEPNDLGDGQDCVEIYIKRDLDAAKWNDEDCKKGKGAICYTASCSERSCQNGTCVETIGDFKCSCYLGFEGPRCERAVECPAMSGAPSGGSMNCSQRSPPHRCNSTCEFRCDEGFLLQGAQRTECDATGQWTHPAPTCTVVTCDPLLVPSGVHFTCENPLGASSYNSTCNFSCKTGHTLTGPANLTCLASGTWSAAAPVCEVVRCGQLNASLNGKLRCQNPLEKFSYNSTCWSECDSGFILKGSNSTHCSARGQWSHALPVCQAVECPAVFDAPSGGSVNCSHPIALHSFNSTCEFRCDEGFLLQGAERTECDATGQWTHPAPTCTAVRCEHLKDPSNGTLRCQDPLEEFSYNSTCWSECDSGFILKGSNSTHCSARGQWSHALPVCQVVTCDPLLVPSGVDFTCENPLGASSYNSTCNFSCKTGHTLTGPANLTCLASGTWSAAAPVCEVVRCGQLNASLNGKLRCQNPLEKFSYNSTCWSECDSGFILKGSNSTHCSARGQWSHALPVCQAVECPAVFDAPSGGSVNCSHPIALHSFNSTCEFRCDEGFLLQGAERTECDATGQWTHPAPTCTAVRCEHLKDPSNGTLRCQDPLEEFSYNSTCWSECDSGFILKGSNSTHCSARGQWSHALPVCQVVTCDPLLVPSGVHFTCENPLGASSYNSTCNFSCKTGHTLTGPANLTCLASGTWSAAAPVCEAVECPAVFDAPSGGSVNCSHPISPSRFNSTCEFRCDEGFLLQGAQRTECDATGQWTHPAPTCTAVKCEHLKDPSSGTLRCQDPLEEFSYNSTCWSECDSGFILKGSNSTHCSARGQWSHALPVCQVVTCDPLLVPSGVDFTCENPLGASSYNSTCNFSCKTGHTLTGPANLTCLASGTWSAAAPVCEAVECPAVFDAPSGGSVNCSHPISPSRFNSTCEFRCDEGFLLQGAQRTECDATGQWTHPAPTCTAVRCEHLKEPSNGTLRCQKPLEEFSYNSTCWSECDSGFILKGSNSTHCSARGQWSNTLPVCQAVECPAVPDAPSGGAVNCSHPIALHSFTSSCEFRCDEGLQLQGALRIECGHTGQWTPDAPTCTVSERPLGAALLKYTAVGGASVLGLLGLIGVGLLVRHLTKKASSSMGEAWNSGVNPVFDSSI